MPIAETGVSPSLPIGPLTDSLIQAMPNRSRWRQACSGRLTEGCDVEGKRRDSPFPPPGRARPITSSRIPAQRAALGHGDGGDGPVSRDTAIASGRDTVRLRAILEGWECPARVVAPLRRTTILKKPWAGPMVPPFPMKGMRTNVQSENVRFPTVGRTGP